MVWALIERGTSWPTLKCAFPLCESTHYFCRSLESSNAHLAFSRIPARCSRQFQPRGLSGRNNLHSSWKSLVVWIWGSSFWGLGWAHSFRPTVFSWVADCLTCRRPWSLVFPFKKKQSSSPQACPHFTSHKHVQKYVHCLQYMPSEISELPSLSSSCDVEKQPSPQPQAPPPLMLHRSLSQNQQTGVMVVTKNCMEWKIAQRLSTTKGRAPNPIQSLHRIEGTS